MPEELHRCVAAIVAKGYDEQSAYAICQSAMSSADLSDEQIAAAIHEYERKRMTTAALSAAVAEKMRVLSRNPDGSGVIEIPALRVGKLDLSLATKGKGDWDVTRDTLAEIAGNFSRWPGPVPVGVHPHKPVEESGGPMPAFIEATIVRGDELWLRIFATAPLFGALARGEVRGFSGEFAQNMKLPAVTLSGWSIYGGVFTNRPAADVNFKPAIAASAAVSLSIGLESREEKRMPEDHVSLAIHEAAVKDVRTQLTVANETIASLNARLETGRSDLKEERTKREDAEGRVISLNTELTAVKATANQFELSLREHKGAVVELTNKISDLTNKLVASENVNLAEKVKAEMDKAIKAGVPPAIFEAFRKDPVAALTARHGGKFEAFAETCAALSGVPFSKPGETVAKSGHEPGKEADPEAVHLTAEEQAEAVRLGLDTSFVGIRTEAEARKIWEAKQKAKKANQVAAK